MKETLVLTERSPGVLGSVEELPLRDYDPRMEYGVCHHPGGCPCLSYVVPNAGPNLCANCGHTFQVHW
jgi:hypothetical protein